MVKNNALLIIKEVKRDLSQANHYPATVFTYLLPEKVEVNQGRGNQSGILNTYCIGATMTEDQNSDPAEMLNICVPLMLWAYLLWL